MPVAPTISIEQNKKRYINNALEKYMKNCESRNLGTRAIEDKKHTFKLLRKHDLISFEDLSISFGRP